MDKDIRRMIEGKINKRSIEKTNLRDNCLTQLTLFNRGDIPNITYLFNKCGEDVRIKPPFNCDYGKFIECGNHVFINTNCIILDACSVKIGDNVMIGPRVTICSATHPIDAKIREDRWYISKPVIIGNNVWICAGAIINPGVTIGDRSIIGAGAVVTKDIPSDVIAFGNPATVYRQITKEDTKYWQNLVDEYYKEE